MNVVLPKARAARDIDKKSAETRQYRSDLINSTASSGPIWQANRNVADAGKNVISAGKDLVAKEKAAAALEAQAATARQEVVTLTKAWDTLFNIYAGNVELVAVKPEDIKSCALVVLDVTVNTFAGPLDVIVKYDVLAALIRINVKAPPGEYRCRIEISPDPITPGSFIELKGHGARRALAGYPPGGYWVRAAMTDYDDQSDWFGPVYVLVK